MVILVTAMEWPDIVVIVLYFVILIGVGLWGAFWGMIGGFVCGMIRMCLDWSRAAPFCGSDEPDNRFSIIAKVHYLHFAAILAVITSIIITIVSLVTKPRPENKLRRVTWWTKNSKDSPDLSDDDESDDDNENHNVSTEKHDQTDQYTAVIIGVSVSVGACALALIVFLIIFCRLRIKEDSNVRKRIITKKAFPEKRPETPPPPEPEPIPMPIIMPPPPQPVLIPRPIRLQPLPPPPPPPLEPRVIVREIYHNSEDFEPTPVLQRVRRRSWAGSSDEWVMVKKTKRRNRRTKRSDDSCSSSSSDSSDSDDECKKRTKPKHVAYPAMMAVQRCAVPRLEPYDLAMSNNNGLNARAAPRVLNIVPVNPGMRPFAPVSQPTVMMPGVSGNQLGYVSVMMPQHLQ